MPSHLGFPYRTSVQCKGFAPAAPRRARNLVSDSVSGLWLSSPVPITGTVGRYPTVYLIGRSRILQRCLSETPHSSWRFVSAVNLSFPRVSLTEGELGHVLLSYSPRVWTRSTSMAKSNPNSNVLRQDQPECVQLSRRDSWGLAGLIPWRESVTKCVSLHGLCSGPRERSGGTELPRLTSDPGLRRTAGVGSPYCRIWVYPIGRYKPVGSLVDWCPLDPCECWPVRTVGGSRCVFAAFQVSALLNLRALVRSGCRPAVPDERSRVCFHTQPVHMIEDGVNTKGLWYSPRFENKGGISVVRHIDTDLTPW
jgi:hypothetical protein